MTTSLAHELVCIDCATGHPLEQQTGLETEAELPSREGIGFDEPSLRRLVAERLGTRS